MRVQTINRFKKKSNSKKTSYRRIKTTSGGPVLLWGDAAYLIDLGGSLW